MSNCQQYFVTQSSPKIPESLCRSDAGDNLNLFFTNTIFSLEESSDKIEWKACLHHDDLDSDDIDGNNCVTEVNESVSEQWILQKSNLDLPKDTKTLLKTDRNIITASVAGGEYFYIGLKRWLSLLLNNSSTSSDFTQITIHINIDGISLFNSSNISLWPILGSIVELEGSNVSPITLYGSSHKPNSLNDYLNDFIQEMKSLEQCGFSCKNSKQYKVVVLGAVICDAPARLFIKCIKMHNSYNCCERCTQKGEWYNKIILPELVASLRTDDSFLHQDDSINHTSVSPFTQLSYKMVSGFPLDYMHLICLEVVRR
ncbi:uncharacterized protein LOC136087125 [Hydra vulgaris]|uniref:Uncharacterized protein LOC136087125 n=1 Tax=Hydra vulgaris TaxID=6087 RepID=A0ABM4CUT5_HYDVU